MVVAVLVDQAAAVDVVPVAGADKAAVVVPVDQAADVDLVVLADLAADEVLADLAENAVDDAQDVKKKTQVLSNVL